MDGTPVHKLLLLGVTTWQTIAVNSQQHAERIQEMWCPSDCNSIQMVQVARLAPKPLLQAGPLVCVDYPTVYTTVPTEHKYFLVVTGNDSD